MAGENGPVIYLSTVSKSLAPGIRIAYMVLPEGLLKEWNVRYGSYSNTVSRAEQQTFCRFLEEGYFTRHLARMRNTCRGRRNALAKALEEEFSGRKMILKGLHPGGHQWVGKGMREFMRKAETGFVETFLNRLLSDTDIFRQWPSSRQTGFPQNGSDREICPISSEKKRSI